MQPDNPQLPTAAPAAPATPPAPQEKPKKPKTNEERLQLLKSRLKVAQAFCKKPHESMKAWIREYNIEDVDDTQEIRDKVRIGYIFRKTEQELPAIFDDQPDLFIKGRQADTKPIEPLIQGTYDFLWDVQNLEEVIEDAGTLFSLLGMGFVDSPYVTKTRTVMQEQPIPVMAEDGVTPATDEQGQPLTMPGQVAMEVPVIDNPKAEAVNPFHLFFSPETTFRPVMSGENCPGYFRKRTMTPEEIKDKYGVSAETNETLKIDDVDDAELEKDTAIVRGDLKRATVWEYYGLLPRDLAPKGTSWAYDKEYRCVFTADDELLVEESKYESYPLHILGNYGLMTRFFRFGEAKHLLPLVQEMEFYRTKILKHTRKMSSPKPMQHISSEIDDAAWRDPLGDLPLKWNGPTPPGYLQPAPLGREVETGVELVRTDLEKQSGQFDLGGGGSQSTVRTPRGIQVYAEAADKNIARKRKKLARFIRQLMIFQFKLIGEFWKPEDGKTLAVIADGTPQSVQVTSEVLEVLKGVNLMYALDIEVESLSLNKPQMRQDALDLWAIASQHPDVFNLQELARDMLQNGFGKKDADRFLVSAEQLQAMQAGGPKPTVSMSIRVDASTPIGMKLLEKEGLLSPADVQEAQAMQQASLRIQAQPLLEGGDANATPQPQPGPALPAGDQGQPGQ